MLGQHFATTRWTSGLLADMNYVRRLRTDEWNGLETNNELKSHSSSFGPRHLFLPDNHRDQIVLTKVRVGHSRLTHGFLMTRPHVTPKCGTCDVNLTLFHLTMECTEFSTQRSDPKLAGSWTQVMTESSSNYSSLLKYLKATGIYNQI